MGIAKNDSMNRFLLITLKAISDFKTSTCSKGGRGSNANISSLPRSRFLVGVVIDRALLGWN